MLKELPEKFVNRLHEQFPDEHQDIIDTFHQKPPIVRTNELLISPSELKERLEKQGVKLKKIPLLEYSFVADTDRRTLTDTEEYAEGLFYIQSIASQLIVKALNPQPGEKIMDLCAAPGSKTTQIAIQMKKEGELIANDNNRKRLYRLKSNLEHQKLDDFVTVKNYSGQNYPKFYPEYFDRVLVDAPCSSEARFDMRYPKSIRYWSTHKVKAFAKLGKRLLGSAIKCTRPGGTIVYSTCTYSPEENEMVIDQVLKKYSEVEIEAIDWKIKKLPIVKSWNDKDLNPEISKAMRLLPDPETEGFFICKLRKKQST